MNNKKGQAAMEFLMTYGWAILVVLAAIGALAYFGVLSLDRFLPERCTITTGFSCADYAVDGTNDEIRLYLTNNLGVRVTSYNVSLDGDCNVNATGLAGLDNGDTALTNFSCTMTSGERFDADITVSYLSSTGFEPHQTTGSIQAVVS